jgi:hypothetical protein
MGTSSGRSVCDSPQELVYTAAEMTGMNADLPPSWCMDLHPCPLVLHCWAGTGPCSHPGTQAWHSPWHHWHPNLQVNEQAGERMSHDATRMPDPQNHSRSPHQTHNSHPYISSGAGLAM